MVKVKVRTSSEKFQFKIQGKMVDNVNYIRVNLDHNVQCKLDTGILVLVLDEKTKKEVVKNVGVEAKEKKVLETNESKKKKVEK